MEGLSLEQRESCKNSDWCSGENTMLCNEWRDYANRKINNAINMTQCKTGMQQAIQDSIGLLDDSDKKNPLKVKKAAREVLCRCFGFENEDHAYKCFLSTKDWECLNKDSTDAECKRWSEFEETHLKDYR